MTSRVIYTCTDFLIVWSVKLNSTSELTCCVLKWETRYFLTTNTHTVATWVYSNMIISHSVYVGVVWSTVNYFILTVVVEDVVTHLVNHTIWCNQSQISYYLQGCVKKHNMQSLLHSQRIMYRLVKYSTWNIMHQYSLIWIFITHWGRNNTVTFQMGHTKFLQHKYQISLFNIHLTFCLILFPAIHVMHIIDVTNLQAWGMRVHYTQVLSAYKAVTFKWTWHDLFCHWVVV